MSDSFSARGYLGCLAAQQAFVKLFNRVEFVHNLTAEQIWIFGK
jgi:hypothetical protein